jgi:hypothetical protein
MRSREMLSRLDRFPIKTDEDRRLPDISFLCPEDQDRVMELLETIEACDTNRDQKKLLAARREVTQLLCDLPLIDRDNGRLGGPNIDVPRTLERYWRWTQPASSPGSYRFGDLKAVQKVRFVELCRHYGWREDTPPNATILPISEWADKDRSEMNTLLDAADHPGPLAGMQRP